MRFSVLLWVWVLSILPAFGEVPDNQKGVEHAPMGALIVDVGDFDRQGKHFDATFWLWTLTQRAEENPLEHLSFPNAIEIKESVLNEEKTSKGRWITRKIRGTFRHPWNMSDFPFDNQTLNIRIEVEGRDYSKLRFIDDGVTSIVDPKLVIPGWKIEGAALYADKSNYRSSFGDPRLPKSSEVTYAAADVSLSLKRENDTTFWKLTIAAFVAAGLAIPAFLIQLDTQTRLGLLTASVFADVLSMQSASSDMGAVEYITLVDMIHILVLIYTSIATVFVIYTNAFHSDHELFEVQKRRGYRAGIIATSVLILAMAGYVFRAWSH